MKRCPDCAEQIQDEAVVCRFCGLRLEPKDSPGDSDIPKPADATASEDASRGNGESPSGKLSDRIPFDLTKEKLLVGGVVVGFLVLFFIGYKLSTTERPQVMRLDSGILKPELPAAGLASSALSDEIFFESLAADATDGRDILKAAFREGIVNEARAIRPKGDNTATYLLNEDQLRLSLQGSKGVAVAWKRGSAGVGNRLSDLTSDFGFISLSARGQSDFQDLVVESEALIGTISEVEWRAGTPVYEILEPAQDLVARWSAWLSDYGGEEPDYDNKARLILAEMEAAAALAESPSQEAIDAYNASIDAYNAGVN